MGLRNDVKQRLKNKFSAAFAGIWVGITTDRSIKFQWIIGLLVTGVLRICGYPSVTGFGLSPVSPV